MSFLTLRYHGGECCGVKHLHGFGTDLSRQEPAVTDHRLPNVGETHLVYLRTDKWGQLKVEGEIPAETTVERLDRYLKWCEDYHKWGITEAVLTTAQVIKWEEILIERGFKKVGDCRNSNSQNRIHVYLQFRDEPQKAPVAKEKPLR